VTRFAMILTLFVLPGITSAQPNIVTAEDLHGYIEVASRKGGNVLFISIDTHRDGMPERGFLLETAGSSLKVIPTKRPGHLRWRRNESLELVFPDSTLRFHISRQSAPARSERVIGIQTVAIQRLEFIKPMSHEALAPGVLQRQPRRPQ